jgi:hypothetical protein
LMFSPLSRNTNLTIWAFVKKTNVLATTLYTYCDGFGVSYATSSQNTWCIRYERCYSTALGTKVDTRDINFNCQEFLSNQLLETRATGNVTVGEDVFFPRCKHPVWGAADKRTDTEKER